MEMPCLSPSEGHKYGARKLTKTYVIEFAIKKACSRLLRAHKHLFEYLFSYRDCSDCKILVDKSLFLTYITAFLATILTSCHAKA